LVALATYLGFAFGCGWFSPFSLSTIRHYSLQPSAALAPFIISANLKR
jgi:hypothetical protein